MFFHSINPDLFVRSLIDSDLNDIFDQINRNRSDAGNFVQLDSSTNISSLRRSLCQYREAFAEGKGLYLGIFVERRFRGEVRFVLSPNGRDERECVCNMAYWLDSGVRGRNLVYDCLKSVLPVLHQMKWVNHSRIIRFEATIERTNQASQNILDKLGFQRSASSESSIDLLLDQVAPRAVHEWTLMSARLHDPGFFDTSRASYDSRKSLLKSQVESDQCTRLDRLSLFSSLFDALSDPQWEEPDLDSYSILVDLQNALGEIIGEVAPDRVLSTDIVTLTSPVKIDHFGGLWRDPESLDSLIIVHGNFCVKGYEQLWDSHNIAGLTITEVLASGMLLMDVDVSHTWERVSLGTIGQLDGIWKTSRGFVAINGSKYVSCCNVWEIRPETSSGRWTLAMGDQWLFNLKSTTFEEILWCTITDTTVMKRSSRKRGNTGPVRWARELSNITNPETATYINSFSWSLGNKAIQNCIALRTLEIGMLLRFANPDRKTLKRFGRFRISDREAKELSQEHQLQVKHLDDLRNLINIWVSISFKLSDVPFERIADNLAVQLEVELDN